MNFKKPKGQVIHEANAAAFEVVRHRINTIRYSSPASGLDAMGDMMVFAIDAAIVSIVNNMYTDDEFESDIGLKG